MESPCAFCNNVRTLLLGNVYCSKHSPSMHTLASGTALLRGTGIEADAHVSRLSIRTVREGRQYYKLGSHHHVLSPDQFLLINQGQTYETAFLGEEETEMFLIAFQPGFAEQLLYSLSTPEDKLLDNPYGQSAQPVQFFEQTYAHDPELKALLDNLYRYVNHPEEARLLDFDSIYTAILHRMLTLHRSLQPGISQLTAARPGTRAELYKRLAQARDFMDAFAEKKLTLDEIAGEACLSKFHFLRLFKQLYGLTPHQYLLKLRLSRSRELLLSAGQRTVREISQELGFDDPGSFGKLFKKHFGLTPVQFQGQAG
jgi:AraC family transcriptional regulator